MIQAQTFVDGIFALKGEGKALATDMTLLLMEVRDVLRRMTRVDAHVLGQAAGRANPALSVSDGRPLS